MIFLKSRALLIYLTLFIFKITNNRLLYLAYFSYYISIYSTFYKDKAFNILYSVTNYNKYYS